MRPSTPPAFYGPFREAAESAPAFGDRRSYQMDPANAREALREVLLDVEEGADLVMVKPAGPYLDVIRQVRDAVQRAGRRLPGVRRIQPDQGRGGQRGWIDERAAVLETLTGIHRAGADLIITYFAPDSGAVAARVSVHRPERRFLAACRRQPVPHTPDLGHAPGRALPAGVPRSCAPRSTSRRSRARPSWPPK